MCDEFNAFLEKGTVIQILKLCETLALTRLIDLKTVNYRSDSTHCLLSRL